MASRPPVQCPLCSGEIPPEKRLEDHLVEEHSKRELAEDIVTSYERLEESELAG